MEFFSAVTLISTRNILLTRFQLPLTQYAHTRKNDFAILEWRGENRTQMRKQKE
jgi:hypothetical protein